MDKQPFNEMSDGEKLLAEALAHLLDAHQEFYIAPDGNVRRRKSTDSDYSYDEEESSIGMAAEEDATYE